MPDPNLTEAEQLMARSFGLSDAEYAVYRDGGNADDLERRAELARKAAEEVDVEEAVATERARRAAA